MGIQTTGLKEVRLKLERLREAPSIADAELKKCAIELQTTAKNMAPIDYGDLKDAIQIRRLGFQGSGGRFMRGISNYQVYVNNRHPVADPEKIEDGITHVGDYAWDVHEHMGYGSTTGEIMPSERSVREGRRHGVEAGGKFMTRAAIRVSRTVGARISMAVRAFLATLDK